MTGPTKLKIDLSRGVIEMEGDEAFVEKNLKEVKDLLYGMNRTRADKEEIVVPDNDDRDDRTLPLLTGANEFTPKSRLMELTSSALNEFLEPLNLKDSEMEYVTALTYYLKEREKWPVVTFEDLNRCYRLIKRPVPNLIKAVDNAGSKRSWLRRDRKEGILLTREGINFIEFPDQRASSGVSNGARRKEGSARSGTSTPPPVRVKGDLDIYGKSGQLSFKEFSKSLTRDDNISRIAVAAYYLTELIHLNSFDADDIFTVFDHMRWKPPTYLKNNLYNHAKSHGFYTTSEDGKFQGTLKLKIFVEHEIGLSKPELQL